MHDILIFINLYLY